MVIGVIAATATVNGLFLNFVKPSLRIPLVLASLVLIGMGLYGVFVEDRRAPEAPLARTEPMQGSQEAAGEQPGTPEHPHTHQGGPKVGWLLVVPFLLMGIVVPPPLGSYSAQQDTGQLQVTTAEGLGPLPSMDGPVSLSLSEFAARALYDPGRTLEGRVVSLTGFASPGTDPGSWVLTRMVLACCAADGYAVKVVVKNAPHVDHDQWVSVTGVWEPTSPTADPSDIELPILLVDHVTPVPTPENPYE